MTSKALAVSAKNWIVPCGSIDQYISRVRNIPILTAEEERALAIDLFENQSREAAQKLIVHHLNFVVHIARGFSGYGLALADLIQEGNIGLMKAVKRFDPSHGVRLISFAVHWIKSEIHEYVIRNWRMVRIATTKSQRKLFFNLRSMKKSFKWLNEQEAKHIADELNVPVKDVYEMESRIQGKDIAFDAPDDDDEDNFSPSAWLTDSSYDPAKTVEREEEHDYYRQRLFRAIDKLDSRSREIVEARWLNEDKKVTLQNLADKYQVSAERIRQIEAQAFLELKNSIEADVR
ncbi:MAG: RNA polymerase sigma factor RpoH [Cardiobacteriaceae bacterium]|nr:RNA polymerase sigma factor RpoH [Cardiobacteriaceae bacterium]